MPFAIPGLSKPGFLSLVTGVGAVVWVGAGPCGFGKIADRQPALNSTATRIATENTGTCMHAVRLTISDKMLAGMPRANLNRAYANLSKKLPRITRGVAASRGCSRIVWQFFGREYQDTDKYLFLGKHPTVERRDGGKSSMDDPELQGDEQILIRTQGVHVKSISFEAILTNKGIILVDRLKNLLPPKEIPLTTIQSIEPGENAIRDLTITLGVITKAGGARQMVLTFSREGGGNRIKERDEWVRQIRGYIIPSFEQVIRKVIPGIRPSASRS